MSAYHQATAGFATAPSVDGGPVSQVPTFLVIGSNSFGTYALRAARLFVVERYYCRLEYPTGELIDGLCKTPSVQSALAKTIGGFEVAMLVSSLLLTAPYGALATMSGKKTILCVSAMSQLCSAAFVCVVFAFGTAIDIRWIWLAPVLNIFGGGPTVFSSLAYAYVAENSSSAARTGGMFSATAWDIIAGFSGMLAGSALLRINVWYLLEVGTAALVVCVPATIWLPQAKDDGAGERSHLLSAAEPGVIVAKGDGPESGAGTEDTRSRVASWSREACHPCASFIRILRHEALLLRVVLIVFVNRCAISVNVVFAPWASQVLGWKLADTTGLQAIAYASAAAVFLALPWVVRVYLLPWMEWCPQRVDVFLAKVSIFGHGLGIMCIGLSTSSWQLAIAIVLYTLGVGLETAMQSFSVNAEGSSAVPPEMIFLGISIASSAGAILGTFFWSQIFAALDVAGIRMLFLLCGGLFWGTMILVARLEQLHQRSRRAGSGRGA